MTPHRVMLNSSKELWDYYKTQAKSLNISTNKLVHSILLGVAETEHAPQYFAAKGLGFSNTKPITTLAPEPAKKDENTTKPQHLYPDGTEIPEFLRRS
ncbi:MAG TPA: hypothetical protein VF748_15120 [Candidatus Acidoferrum sp.]